MKHNVLNCLGLVESSLRRSLDQCRSIDFRRSIYRHIIQTLFQERCRICRNDIPAIHSFGDGDVQCLCEECWKLMTATWLLEDDLATCRISKDLTQSNDWSAELGPDELVVSSAVQYEKQVKKLIRRFKFDDDRLLAQDLYLLLARAWRMLLSRVNADSPSISELHRQMIFVPVPLSQSRLKERGFNQSLVLATKLSKSTNVPVRSNGLRRAKATKPQSGLSRQDRIKNVESAFHANEKVVRNKHVILIDDVCTSGATLISCANAVTAKGASKVSALTIARALRRNF